MTGRLQKRLSCAQDLFCSVLSQAASDTDFKNYFSPEALINVCDEHEGHSSESQFSHFLEKSAAGFLKSDKTLRC